MSGSVGNSAELGRNEVCTWWEARRWLDARFTVLKQDGLTRLVGDPCAQAVWARLVMKRWRAAVQKLARKVLPQKARVHVYRPVKTVNFEVAGRAKVKPRNSLKRKIAKGFAGPNRTRGRKRSHHKGVYVSHGKRGRPPTVSVMSESDRKAHLRRQKQRARNKAKRATAERRKAMGWKPYGPRRAPAVVEADRARKRATSAAIKTARAVVGPLRGFEDDRKNHDARYAYLAPWVRERATSRQAASGRHFKRVPGPAGNPGAGAMLAARRIKANLERALHMRGYWQAVKRRASKK